MFLGIGRDGDLEIAYGLEARDEIGRVREAVGARFVRHRARGRVAAQRDDVADALVPILARDVEHFAAARADAGEVRHAIEARLFLHARDDVVSALAGAAIGAVGHGHEGRAQRLEIPDGFPECLLHHLVGGRKELEGNGNWLGTGHRKTFDASDAYAGRPVIYSRSRSALVPILDYSGARFSMFAPSDCIG
jgi:hypothetical protein